MKRNNLNEEIKENNEINKDIKDIKDIKEDEIDLIEADTFESEDNIDILTYLLPKTILNYLQFSFSYNKKLFDCWIKQPSPCCAAASLASSLNCLLNLNRNHSYCLNYKDILFIYEIIIKRNIYKKKQSFERCLGNNINEFLNDLFEYIKIYEENNLKKKKNIGKITLIKLTKQVVFDKLQEIEQNKRQLIDETSTISTTSTITGSKLSNPSAYELLKELIDSENSLQNEENDLNEKEEENDIEGEDLLDDDQENIELTSSSKLNIQQQQQSTTSVVLVHNTWDWKASLFDLYKKIHGLSKLQSVRPNTAPIGNWGLISAIQFIQIEILQESSLLNIYLLMGKGKKTKKVKKITSTTTGGKSSKNSTSSNISGNNGSVGTQSSVQIGISSDDTPEMITEQWHSLKNTFENNDSVLIFHLKNHYALIYATREWSIINQTTGELEINREILTARRGQRPTAWINFNEVRNTILSWEGYKIMCVTRKSSKSEVIQLLQTIKSNLVQYQENYVDL